MKKRVFLRDCFKTVQCGRDTLINHTGETPVPHVLKQFLKEYDRKTAGWPTL